MNADLGRRLLAEFVGTALLVVFGAGAVVAALEVGNGKLDYAGLGIIGLSFALVIAAVVYMFGSTSGAHINPAVTFSLAVVRRFPWVEVIPYFVAQLVGALAGAVLINAIFGSHASDLNVSGGTIVGAGFTKTQAAVAEGLGTFLLLATIMALAVDRRAPAGFAGLVIGLAVACEIMVIGPISGGSVNPARTFGPYLATDIFGGSTPWSEFWVYWAGPLVGGALAALAYDLIAQPERAAAAAEAEIPQGTAGEVQGRRVLPEEEPQQTGSRSTTEGRQPDGW
ncbi:MAG TPA: MIP/aquaporin family protein [Solirubrobacteraceae bacterium]|nr:MIP/aquaporin family protein [Solirubrobacteraceae bacterium]